MNIIGISGKLKSGKNTVATIIQGLNASLDYDQIIHQIRSNKPFDNSTGFEQKAFADKLKDITCLLIGCSREDLENQEFKEKPLGEEWWKATHTKTGEVISYQEFLDRKYVHVGKWKVTKTNPRLLMQLIGSECGRDILHPNLWINSLFVDYKKVNSIRAASVWDTEKEANVVPKGHGEYSGRIINMPYFEYHLEEPLFPNWIVSDVRYENECKAIKDRGGILIRVNRPDKVTNSRTGESFPIKVHRPSEHISETSLDDYQGFDYVINNDSDIPALIEKVKEILKQENII